MKDVTRLMKQIGLAIYGEKGYVEHKTEVVRTRWILLHFGHKILGAKENPLNRTIEVFEKGAIKPTYIIPRSFLVNDLIGFTKCKECGNLAIFDKNPVVTCHRVSCIEPPTFHEYIVEDLNKIEEIKRK